MCMVVQQVKVIMSIISLEKKIHFIAKYKKSKGGDEGTCEWYLHTLDTLAHLIIMKIKFNRNWTLSSAIVFHALCWQHEAQVFKLYSLLEDRANMKVFNSNSDWVWTQIWTCLQLPKGRRNPNIRSEIERLKFYDNHPSNYPNLQHDHRK